MNRFLKFLCWAMLMVTLSTAHADNVEESAKTVPIKEFIETAIANDVAFEEILIDELSLKYQKDINLPAGDLVLSVKQQHEFYFSQDRDDPDTTVSLSKLFPYHGTQIDVDYSVGSTIASSNMVSELGIGLSQPIAKNAFGRSTDLYNKIIGLENDVARHQIVEAYEDYLATVITAYYNWYEAYENLKIARASYQENLKLLDNIERRAESSIALPIDVNKITLQVMAKEERLVNLEEAYRSAYHEIERILRFTDDAVDLVPTKPDLYQDMIISFQKDYRMFKNNSRTYHILDLLEEKSTLEVDREADDLLPSLDLIVGYGVKGSDYEIDQEDDVMYAGIEFEWPFGHQVDRAEYEVAKIDLEKRQLINENTYYVLYTNIKNLSEAVHREEKLKMIADKKIKLAEDILIDETENYSFGKVSLNDYIQAVNTRDTNLYSQIESEVQTKRFIVEWLRLTDQLVQAEKVLKGQ